ncbi:MAG: hypothetical protein ACRDLT_16155 [Solirubrobacteraceae bacterium]
MGKRKKAEEKPKKKKRRVRKVFFLLLIGGAGALVLSEDVRNKALDALFGSEEEFQYSPPDPSSGDAAGDGAGSTS